MSLSRQLSAGLRTIFSKDAAESDLDDEIKHYIEMATRQRMRDGLSRADAERAARIQFGGVEATKQTVRDGGWEAKVETFWQDVRYALRGLRRNPGFTIVATLTLALGIGANAAMFSVVNAVMLRPLPYRDAGRLALIWTDDLRRGLHNERTAFRTIQDWRENTHTFDGIAFYNTGRSTLSDAAGRERVLSATVSGNLFSLLGVAPMFGRTVSVDDETGAANVAVISHSLWQRRFGSDSNVVGKVLPIEGAGKDGTGALRIIGVMPAGFYFPNKGTDYWTPSTTYWRFRRESTERFPEWSRRWIGVARLSPNTSMEAARADLARVGQHLSQLYRSDIPDFPGFGTNVVPMLDSIAGKNLQSALWLLLGSVFLVLLVACANVANLLLARGAGRQHEFALRGALGAGRGRLARQLVVESLVLASLGGAIGIMVAAGGTRLLGVAAAAQIPRIDEVTVDGRVLGFAALISLVAGVIFGVAPAARVWSTDVSEILKEGSRSSGGRRLRRTRGLLVVAECAMAIMLLAGAGLLLRSLDRLRSTDPGFDPAHVLNVRVEFPQRAPTQTAGVTQLDEVRSAMAHSQILANAIARLETAPGIEAVGLIDDMFISSQGHASITIPGRGDSLNTGELTDGAVTPGFFKAMRVSLRRGRLLEPADGATKIQALWAPIVTNLSLAEKERGAIPEPVVVNEAFVRRFFPTEDPIGKRFCIDPTNKTYWYVIVGVIGNMHRQGLDRDAIPEYLGPLVPRPNSRMDLFLRTKGDPIALAPTVRQLITSSIPGSLIVSVARTDRLLDGMSASRALQTWLLTAFAALALVLAAVGIYGVVHYAVAERTREMGVRVALGAAAPDVLRLVVVQGMRLPVIGIALGIIAALAVSRTMTHLLFGTRPTDPMTYVGVALTLTAVALCACIVPARRAARVDPVVALRVE